MMNKKMKILLAMGAMAAVVLASGCGGDAKSGESAAKAGSGIQIGRAHV